jgi:hypothetical protein
LFSFIFVEGATVCEDLDTGRGLLCSSLATTSSQSNFANCESWCESNDANCCHYNVGSQTCTYSGGSATSGGGGEDHAIDCTSLLSNGEICSVDGDCSSNNCDEDLVGTNRCHATATSCVQGSSGDETPNGESFCKNQYQYLSCSSGTWSSLQSVSTGDVCKNGASPSQNPSGDSNCGNGAQACKCEKWLDSIEGECSADEYLVGFTSSGTCTATGWVSAGSSSNVPANYVISSTSQGPTWTISLDDCDKSGGTCDGAGVCSSSGSPNGATCSVDGDCDSNNCDFDFSGTKRCHATATSCVIDATGNEVVNGNKKCLNQYQYKSCSSGTWGSSTAVPTGDVCKDGSTGYQNPSSATNCGTGSQNCYCSNTWYQCDAVNDCTYDRFYVGFTSGGSCTETGKVLRSSNVNNPGSYRCNVGSTTAYASYTSIMDTNTCGGGGFCSSGTCQTSGSPNGAVCSVDGDCTSNNCDEDLVGTKRCHATATSCVQDSSGDETPNGESVCRNQYEYLSCSSGTWSSVQSVSTGDVCKNGASPSQNPSANSNCGLNSGQSCSCATWRDCVTNACSAPEYYVGFSGAGCTATGWVSKGTTWNVPADDRISATSQGLTCTTDSNSCGGGEYCDGFGSCGSTPTVCDTMEEEYSCTGNQILFDSFGTMSACVAECESVGVTCCYYVFGDGACRGFDGYSSDFEGKPGTYAANCSVITNYPPNNPTVNINSTDGSNQFNQDLNCFAQITDPEGDNMNVSIRWYVDNSLDLTINYDKSYSNGTNFNAILGSGNTSVGEDWICSMRLFDGQSYSNWVNSSSLTIVGLGNGDICSVNGDCASGNCDFDYSGSNKRCHATATSCVIDASGSETPNNHYKCGNQYQFKQCNSGSWGSSTAVTTGNVCQSGSSSPSKAVSGNSNCGTGSQNCYCSQTWYQCDAVNDCHYDQYYVGFTSGGTCTETNKVLRTSNVNNPGSYRCNLSSSTAYASYSSIMDADSCDGGSGYCSAGVCTAFNQTFCGEMEQYNECTGTYNSLSSDNMNDCLDECGSLGNTCCFFSNGRCFGSDGSTTSSADPDFYATDCLDSCLSVTSPTKKHFTIYSDNYLGTGERKACFRVDMEGNARLVGELYEDSDVSSPPEGSWVIEDNLYLDNNCSLYLNYPLVFNQGSDMDLIPSTGFYIRNKSNSNLFFAGNQDILLRSNFQSQCLTMSDCEDFATQGITSRQCSENKLIGTSLSELQCQDKCEDLGYSCCQRSSTGNCYGGLNSIAGSDKTVMCT